MPPSKLYDVRIVFYAHYLRHDQEGRALPEAIENALRALFCEKNGFSMGVNGRGLGRFSFRPKSPQKGRGHLKHDFTLIERLLPDSTMTYRGRSDGLVVQSDKMITFKCTCRHLRDLQGYCVYTSGVFFFFFFFFLLWPPTS